MRKRTIMREVRVELGERGYRVRIGAGVLRELGAAMRTGCGGDRAVIITDSNVGPLYGQAAQSNLREAGYACEVITVPAGEASKSLQQAERIYDRLGDLKMERTSPLVALGGGVVGDLTGFVAATWLRGVPFVQASTTVEAAVDASVGGKTAVNHRSGKNMIGAFYQPRMVLIDPATFQTLDPRDVRAGLAESIKHGIIRDEEFFDAHADRADEILSLQPEVLTDLLERNVQIKAAVVAEDEREISGIRAHLNFGHTAGHAIESELGYALRHGECVGLGMIVAAEIARLMGMIAEETVNRIVGLLARFKLPTTLMTSVDPERLWELMQHDKKVAGGKIRWVLTRRIGRVEIRDDVGREAVLAALRILKPS
jgi:3-dehydroquinate synthase